MTIIEEFFSINRRIPAVFSYPHEQPTFPIVILLHGFASDKNEVDGFYQKLSKQLAAHGIATLRIDFSGWGKSQEPMVNSHLSNMLQDARDAYQYALNHRSVQKDHIGLC